MYLLVGTYINFLANENKINITTEEIMCNLAKQFELYLIRQGFSVRTPSGNPSTVYDYCKRVNRVCADENLTWETLAVHIATFVREYDIGGSKETEGSKSHRAVINALKAYKAFCKEFNY